MTSSISASDRRRAIRRGLGGGAARNILVMALAAVLTLVVYLGLVIFQMGYFTGAEWWLRDIVNLRRIFYAETLKAYPAGEPKTIIVGGSASLFGVDSALIEKRNREPTLNLGLHAGLDIDLLFAAANEYVTAGDRVVAPLEFELYARDKPTELTPANLLAIFYPYAAPIPLSHYPDMLLAAAPKRILEGVWDRIVATVRGKRRHPLLDDTALLAAWKTVRANKGGPGYGPYDYSTMTDHGDKDLLLNTPTRALPAVVALSAPIQSSLSAYGLRQIAAWRDIIAKEGAELLLTWPIILEDSKGTITTEAYWQQLLTLAKATSEAGQPIYCDPIAAIVPVQYRYDTVYHVNVKGAAIYSEGLAACIRDIDGKAFDWNDTDAATLAARARARLAELKSPPDPILFGYERNLRELAALNASVLEQKSASGQFPAELPVGATAASADGSGPAKAWYRSDGADYKLLIEDHAECYVVELGWPDRIDPIRRDKDKCLAYGYWSQGAADW